ncbi:non-heme iron oxygenase ferredoxin subunit [Quadrisphaera sp. DSM 44207]|uniref:non-heme iron oxygenase ferredoxin subunit n=1 Tax=Quadrisphaera sp. DSM 44207 TaxID=1881057 RepID=UPI000889F364|nr:non-heme iron oxygenase ferredoxin subunit [Quadrisphaera sp. DSM 44207]SDQ43918.1 3-phenylpropionate/trans-cinnamate dioxygenase ferredoxin subunit [Quadrisphaera sp. DSM 44207]
MSAQRVCALADVPQVGAVRVSATSADGAEVPVAVVRDEDGALHAVSDLCSHQDIALSEGDVEGCEIECWLHGSRFDLRTGEPSSLPATAPIPVYRLTVSGDDVLVDVDAEPAA